MGIVLEFVNSGIHGVVLSGKVTGVMSLIFGPKS